MTFLGAYLLAFALACGVTVAAVPLWRSWCHHIGLVDEPGHRKIHAAPIALAGGLAVLTGLLAPLALAWLALRCGFVSPAFDSLGYGMSRRGGQTGVLLAGAIAMAGLGWLDDKYELRPAWKFSGQLAIALAVALAGIRITLFVHNELFSYLITILWILTVTNAFNFMDNMNGLCAGLGAIGAWFLGWSAAVQGQYLVAILAALSCGALMGFLPYNFPRATVFLGDAGSHLVGYWLAVLAILPHFFSRQNPRSWAVLGPLFILAVPLMDLVWVVLIRWRLGKPVYIGDNNHLSHRLVRRGFSQRQAVLLIWLLAAAIASLPFGW